MKIGIDARLYHETGVGRYIRNLLKNLQRIDGDNEYIIFLSEKGYREISLENKKWKKKKASIPWHSVSEQTSFIPILLEEKLDLVHFPYFSFPVFYPKRFVVTIHDLIINHFDTGRATTKIFPVYKLRRIGYHFALHVGLRRASGIIAVSNATKSEIIEHIGVSGEKIAVIYEGADEVFRAKTKEKPIVSNPYFLYVGNAYPHKNAEMLIEAFASFCNAVEDKNVILVFVGSRDYFYRQLKKLVVKKDIRSKVVFMDHVSDKKLQNLYTHAIALVVPSLMEGFGLPVLEAMINKCIVLASDILVFRELFGSLIIYFDPYDRDSLVRLFKKAIKQPVSWKKTVEKAKKHALNFSWKKTARETLQVYNESLSALD